MDQVTDRKKSLNRTIIQYFEWYVEGNHILWNKCRAQAARLAEFGITDVWLPPAYKAGFIEDNVGYAVYDLYDLGEFDQKGLLKTKYGGKQEYLDAIRAFHDADIRVLADVVLNHRVGADEFEDARAVKVNPANRYETWSDEYTISSPTVFNFPGRNGKYSDFKWNYSHFTGVDWDNNEKRTGNIYRFAGKDWAGDVSREMGNFDYLMGADVDVYNPEVRDELIRWGKWYLDTTGVDGFRMDAVKHIGASFIRDYVNEMRSYRTGTEFPVIGEYWHGDVHQLSGYLDQVEGCLSIFDVPLHFNIRQMSYADGNYNMAEIFNGSLLQRRPQNAITFIDNHDSQPGQSLESFVNTWMKQVAYALILLHKDGIPCVFYGDLYGIPCTRNIPIPRLRTLIRVRHDFAYGEQHDYIDDYDVIGWTREGDADHPDSGIAVLLSDKRDGRKRMYIGKHFAGKCFIDCMRKVRGVVTVDEDGFGDFPVQGFSSAVWVTEAAYEFLVINED
ncbi:MAG: alpha-amylase [Lachnospiraceae bacterium]|nr:alpha-amylase [Lachnospiraceae bacterium]